MTTSFHLGHVAGLAALLTTTALPLSTVAATTDHQMDEGVSMAISDADAVAPTLKMMRRGDMAGERFVTDPDEVIQLLLSDATTLTLAGKTDLSVDHYVYDKDKQRGELLATLEAGILKVVGGALNNTTPIIIKTLGGEISIDNATAVIVVEADGSVKAALEYGNGVTLTANDGSVSTIVKPGFEVAIASDGDVSGPYRRPAGDALKIARALNPGLVTGVVPVAEIETTELVAELIETVALEEEEQEEVVAVEEVLEQDEQAVAEVDVDLTETGVEPVQFDDTGAGGALVVAGGFDAGDPVGTLDTADASPSQSSSDRRSLAQNRDPRLRKGDPSPDLTRDFDRDGGDSQFDRPRARGLTTNSIITSNEAETVDLSAEGESTPQKAVVFPIFSADRNARTDLQYVFFGSDGTDTILSDKLALTFDGGEVGAGGFLANDTKRLDAAVIADTLLPTSDGLARDFIAANTGIGDDRRGTVFDGSSSYDVMQSGFALIPISDIDGTIYEGYDIPEGNGFVVDRKLDNFLILQLKPAIVTNLDGVRSRFDFFELRSSVQLQEEFAELIGLEIDESVVNRSDVIVEVARAILVDDYDAAFDFDASGISGVKNAADVQSYLRALVVNPQIDPTQNETFIFAAGDVDSRPDPERRLDTFYLSPGLDGLNEDGELSEGSNIVPAIRAFLRNATALRNEDGTGGIPLGDSGVMIIGAPASSVPYPYSDEQSGLLHADIGVDGKGADQRSTVSVTIGHVQYDAGLSGEEVVLDGRTVGSTQDSGNTASTLAGGDLFNTAAGGGRRVDTNGDGAADAKVDGRATYFVIENFDPDDVNRQGGRERPLGDGASDGEFAFLRLATGRSSVATDTLPSEGGSSTGFAAGMLEQEAIDGSIQVTPATSGFSMTLDPSTNRVAVDGLTIGDQTLEFGGLTGEASKGRSAYVDDNRFAARTDGVSSDVAFVSGGTLQQAAAALTAGDATKDLLDVPEYEHLKWGFFFGDTDVGGADGRRGHIHLGSWVSGDVLTVEDASRLPTSGEATYSGHALGNVVNNSALYTARGTFTNRWNFGSRAGLATLGFDGANMSGLTRLDDETLTFSGALGGDDRTAGVLGAFVRGNESAGEAPAGQIGRFQVTGDDYNAVGTFGAERD